MRSSFVLYLVFPLLTFTLSGCAVLGDVIHDPDVKITETNSRWITPDQWKVDGSLIIKNRNPLTMSPARITYTLASEGRHLQTKVLEKLPVLPPYEIKTIILPFFLEQAKLSKLNVKNHKLPVTLTGEVDVISQNKKTSIPFEFEGALTYPLLPNFSCKQIRAVKKIKGHAFIYTVENANKFQLTMLRTNGFVRIRGNKYKMMPLTKPVVIKPGAKQTFAFYVKNLPIKLLKQEKKSKLVCEIELSSAQGQMILPIEQTLTY